jgi:hypothetical protein
VPAPVAASCARTAGAVPDAITGAVGAAVVATDVVSPAGATSAVAAPVPAGAATGAATMPASSAANASATPVGAASCPGCCWSPGEASVAGWTGVLVSMGAVSMGVHLLSWVVVMPQAILRPPANCPA